MPRPQAVLLLSLVALAQTQTPLRTAAAQRGILVGAATAYSRLTESDYTTTLAREYNALEPENEMKWTAVHPNPPGSPGEYTFAKADALVSFAEAHDMKVRGHNLCWWQYNPRWLANGNYTPAQLSEILKNHIATVAGHFKGQVYAWDVVNEALADRPSGKLRDSIWYNQPGIGQTGFGYITQAFQWARQADPVAVLFYNDYNVEDSTSAKFTAMYNMLKTLLAQGVPIGSVGLQLHVTNTTGVTAASLDANVERLAALGLQVQFTEIDVRVPVDADGHASPADMQAQARRYRDIVAVCLKYKACTLLQTWGFRISIRGFRARIPVLVPGRHSMRSISPSLHTHPSSRSSLRIAPSSESVSHHRVWLTGSLTPQPHKPAWR
jgi:endo-1,4-beta-xylanase